jgi:hypothetical protein
MTSIKLIKTQTQEHKEVPIGFSWTHFFFGFLVPLLRGDMKWAAISFVASFCTLGVAQVVLSFFYNKLYLKNLLQDGFNALDSEGKTYITQLAL